MGLGLVNKPVTRKGKKFLQSMEPQIIEGPKYAIFLKGQKCSEKGKLILKNLYHLKKPHAVMMGRKNEILPFDDCSLIEKFAAKQNTTLFGVCTHSKKRQHNFIMGRTFDSQILDMVELEIEGFKALSDYNNGKICAGIKPCLIFNGSAWDHSTDLIRLKSLFVDFFQRDKVEDYIRLEGIEHVLSFTANGDSEIFLRSYKVLLKKSGQKTPRIELEEIGPSIDFKLRRTKFASDNLFKFACRNPKELKPKTKKNRSTDVFGTKLGRIHMGAQNINSIQTRKIKGLRRTPEERKERKEKKKEALNNLKEAPAAPAPPVTT